MIKIILILILCLNPLLNASSKRADREKLLILIIASDDLPVYPELEKVWQAYMHLYPGQVEAYFIKGDPHLGSEAEILGDTLWVKAKESVYPGVLNKTLLALKYLQPRFDAFSFILRTNLSSFYHIPRLLNFIQTLPKNKCYAGHFERGWNFVSGAGMILSIDIAQMLCENSSKLFDRYNYDDVIIGEFLKKKKIEKIFAPRTDFLSLQAWIQFSHVIPKKAFHFRTKNEDENRRIPDEVWIQWSLYNMFY